MGGVSSWRIVRGCGGAHLFGRLGQRVPSLGTLGANASSSQSASKIGMDLLAVITQPSEISRKWSLWRVGVLGLYYALDLGLNLVLCNSILLKIDGERAAKESSKVELVDVEGFAATEHGIGVADVGASGVAECAFECDP